MNRNFGAIAVAVLLASMLACGGGSTLNVQNPPPPPTTQGATIAFQSAPPANVQINGVVTLAAVVTNDPTSAGVDWSVGCQAGTPCGSITPVHTKSGDPVTYSPPTILTSNVQPVNIVAFASADRTQNVVAPIAVTAFGNILTGAFVIQTNGFDASGSPYQRAGVVVLDGNGNITSGEQTVNFSDPNTGALTSVSDPVTSGTYFVGTDGRGSLTLTTGNTRIGQQGIETFSLVVLSGSRVVLTKIDDARFQGSSGESSIGTMDQQTSVAAPSGGYAFVARGQNLAATAVGIGGVLNIDSPNTLSGAGSVFDLAVNDGSGTITPSSSVSGTVSAPDALGMLQVHLVSDFGPLQLTGYLIDGSNMAIIETDTGGGSGFAVTAGIAKGQGAATGTFTTNKAFKGRFAFGIFGQDTSAAPSSLAAAGIVSASGSGGLGSGFLDVTQSGLQVEASGGFKATYVVDPTGSGRVDTASSFIFNNVNLGTGPELVFYLTGSNTSALVLDADIEPNLGGAGVGTGIAYRVTTGSVFSGTYGVSVAQNFAGTEGDSVGELTVSSGIASGLLDMNLGFSPTPSSTLTDGFHTTATAGRLVGTWTDSDFPSPVSTTLKISYYLIDSNHVLVVETDGGPNGVNPGNLTLGLIEARTPVCPGCP